MSGEMDALKLPLSARGRGCVLAIATCARPSTTGSLSMVTLLLTASRRKMSPHKASDPPCHTMANHGCEPPLQAAQRVVLSCHRSGRATVVGKTASLCSRWRVHKLDLPSSPMNVSCRRDFVCGHAHAFVVRVPACVNRPHTGVTGTLGGPALLAVTSRQCQASNCPVQLWA